MTALLYPMTPPKLGALAAMRRLAAELERFEVVSQPFGDDRLALLPVSGDLVVWCLHGRCFTWWQGRRRRGGHVREYACHPAYDTITVARLVAGRYVDLLGEHPGAVAIRRALLEVRDERLPVLAGRGSQAVNGGVASGR